ncbi:MAG: VOC family protein [Gemmatimonadota bacterium]|jgi:catechol 2,3-dioxygenase-like lactoylglutathione lyase family enzyme|nr:MAG: VOC family protein [Gemmatimonadota bacterium]
MKTSANVLVLVASLAAAGCEERTEAESLGRAGEPILGVGRGVDHVVVAVRDLATSERFFFDTLCFTAGQRAQFSGLENRTIWFADTTYLELVTVRDREQAMNLMPELPGFLDRGEGAMYVGLAVSSADTAAEFLASRGFQVTGPTGGTAAVEGLEEVPPVMWRYVVFREPVVAANAIFFIEYEQAVLEQLSAEYPDLSPLRSAEHANGALGLEAVWMAVEDLRAATRAYESVGLPMGRRLDVPSLGAEAHEIRAGKGAILLLQPSDEGGTVASFLAERGEGVMGVSIEVRDLERALMIVEFNTDLELVPYEGPYGQSILIPADLARGVWIEFFQR